MTNRFKRLDLIDKVAEELWIEVCDIVQEAVIKTIPKKKKCKKAKLLSEEALQITVSRREVKGKGEKERNTHLNVSSVQFSRSVVSDSLRPHELQHARPPCPSPSPGAHPDSHPLSP